MDNPIIIRELAKSEIRDLEYFFYEAIFIPEGQRKPDRNIIFLPELSKYFKDFGKETDVCLVAVLGDERIGAVWTRVFPEAEKGYGFVDSFTPELSMSVAPLYRQQGTGTRLLQAMIEKLIQLGYPQVSLSVDKLNYASAWYPKFGFETVEQNGESVTMVKQLKNNPQTKKLLL